MTEAATRFPLAWPTGWPRTAPDARKNSIFGKLWTLATAIDSLQRQLDALGAEGALLSSNVPVRLDGWPRGDARDPTDPGTALYFRLAGQPRVLAVDRWNAVLANVRALTLHVEALRGLDRWGVGTAQQAFAGYAQLAETAGPGDAPRAWHEVLGVAQTASLAVIEAAYRALSLSAHPDRGGSHAAMSELNLARDVARRVRSSTP